MNQLDYPNPELIDELLHNAHLKTGMESDKIIKELEIIGILLIEIGAVSGIAMGETIVTMISINSGLISGFIFVALEATIRHLQNIDTTLNSR